jgi:hypothetical protein
VLNIADRVHKQIQQLHHDDSTEKNYSRQRERCALLVPEKHGPEQISVCVIQWPRESASVPGIHQGIVGFSKYFDERNVEHNAGRQCEASCQELLVGHLYKNRRHMSEVPHRDLHICRTFTKCFEYTIEAPSAVANPAHDTRMNPTGALSSSFVMLPSRFIFGWS